MEDKNKDNGTNKDKDNKMIKDVKNKPKKAVKIKETDEIKGNVNFNLLEVVIIVLITGIVVSVTSGLIVYNNYDKFFGEGTSNSDELSEFEENYNKIINGYVKEVDKDKLIEAAIGGMYNYLGDNYSMYISKDDTETLEAELNGQYTGIGVEIANYILNEGYEIRIVKVFDGSPADKAGLKANDILIELNGVLLNDKDSTYVANTIKNGNEDNHILKVIRDDKELEIKLTRALVNINSIHKSVHGKTGYVQIDSFSANTTEQLKDALDSFNKNVKSIVIDVRDNTGGYLTAADSISDLFIEKGKNIYQIKDRNGNVDVYKASNGVYRKFDKIAVLINGTSASASEILALALKESAGAVIVGTKSFGKGSVQETERLNSGAMVKYTTSYWLSPNGNSINEIGITPDIVEENVDKQLEKALEAVK